MVKALIELNMSSQTLYGADADPMINSSVQKLYKLTRDHIKISHGTKCRPLKTLDGWIWFMQQYLIPVNDIAVKPHRLIENNHRFF